MRATVGDHAGWAYVPKALPPALEMDLPLVNALSKADRALGELAGLARNLPNPYLLINPFVYNEAVLSSRIEGTRAEVEDLYFFQGRQGVLPGMSPAHPPGDIQEVMNYVTAMEYGLERLDSLPMSLRLMRELHQILLEGVRGDHSDPGNFRRVQNWVGGEQFKDAIYVPPPVPEMLTALDELEKYLHQENHLPSLVRLALIHFQFEAIHPFIDGNGRIGRLLTILLMVNWKLLPLPLLYLSAFFERHRQRYYDLLSGVSQKGQWRPWVEFFLSGVARQAQEALDLSTRLMDLQAHWRAQLVGQRVPAGVLGLADQLFREPIMSVSQARDTLQVSYQTASRYINRLVTLGILTPRGESGYDRLYVARDILRASRADQSPTRG